MACVPRLAPVVFTCYIAKYSSTAALVTSALRCSAASWPYSNTMPLPSTTSIVASNSKMPMPNLSISHRPTSNPAYYREKGDQDSLEQRKAHLNDSKHLKTCSKQIQDAR